jgi:hypothetical protein
LITISNVDYFKKPFLKNQELSERAISYLDSGKFEEALPFISELIKRVTS